MHNARGSSDVHSAPHRRRPRPRRSRPLVGMNATAWHFTARPVSRLGVPESRQLVSNRRIVAVETVRGGRAGAIGTGGSPMTTTSKFGRAALGWCLAAVVLAGCTDTAPEPTNSGTRTPVPTSSTATPTPTTDPEIAGPRGSDPRGVLRLLGREGRLLRRPHSAAGPEPAGVRRRHCAHRRPDDDLHASVERHRDSRRARPVARGVRHRARPSRISGDHGLRRRGELAADLCRNRRKRSGW